MPHRFYSCQLLVDGPPSSAVVNLNCRNDSEAILAGRELAESRQDCSGFEIRNGERLIHRHEGRHLVSDEQPSSSVVQLRKTANEA